MLHTLSLLVVVLVLCVTVGSILSVLQVRGLEKNKELNAKTEQFITAKISRNALKQGSRTHSVLRHRSSHLQNQWHSQNEAEEAMPLPKQPF